MNINYDPVSYKVVFASSAPIGVPFMQALSNDPRFDIVGVVTQPDQPSWRGMKIQANIIKEVGREIEIKRSEEHNQDDNRFEQYKKAIDQKTQTIIGCAIEVHKKFSDTITEKQIQNILYDKLIEQWFKVQKEVALKIIENGKSYGSRYIDLLVDGEIVIELKKTSFTQEIQKAFRQTRNYIDLWNYPSWLLLNFWFSTTKINRFNNFTALPTSSDLWNSSEYIITPNTLRLSSMKYLWEWAAFQSWLESKQADFLVVIAYGNIIPQHILDLPRIAPINVHGSLLPHYRGASPIQSVLLDDQDETGITIMRMEAGLDTWPMLRAQWFRLTIHTTARDIIRQFESFGPQLLIDTMVDYAHWTITEVVQDNTLATHCGKLDKSDWLVDPRSQSLSDINNIYRACVLRPKTYFVLDDTRGKHADKTIIIEEMILDDELWEENNSNPLFSNSPLIKGGGVAGGINPAIKKLTVKPEWGKSMSWEDWLRGI